MNPAAIRRALGRALREALDVSDVAGRASMFVPLKENARAARTRPTLAWDDVLRQEISDENAALIPRGMERLGRKPGARVRLGDILDHPELYADYPWLKRTRITNTSDDADSLGYVQHGIFSPRGDRIGLSLRKRTTPDDNDTLSTLLHEIQHIMQHEGRFGPGGQPTRSEIYFYNGVYPAWRRIHGEKEALDTEARRLLTLAQREATPPAVQRTGDYADIIMRPPTKYLPEFMRDEFRRDNGSLPNALLRASAGLGGLGLTMAIVREALRAQNDE